MIININLLFWLYKKRNSRKERILTNPKAGIHVQIRNEYGTIRQVFILIKEAKMFAFTLIYLFAFVGIIKMSCKAFSPTHC